MYAHTEIRKKLENQAYEKVMQNKERVIPCKVIAYDPVTKLATVDLITGGYDIPSDIVVNVNDEVLVRYKNNYNYTIISLANP